MINCVTLINSTIDYDEFQSLVNLKLICGKGIRNCSRLSNRRNYTGYTISITSVIIIIIIIITIVCWDVNDESILVDF